ncbi:TIGR02328 family protein [Weissella viridescens]|uniref:TIGR02328 family protein n=1 Tax=Weissella viridescens TaxID=1629 RepID=UPI003527A78D
MRLWHEELISKLPRQQLLGQHRECCALRGGGWGKKHRTVDYAFNHSPYKLVQYHEKVMLEMQRRHFKPDIKWFDPLYRGTRTPPYVDLPAVPLTHPIYPEHVVAYYQECLDNLATKNIYL